MAHVEVVCEEELIIGNFRQWVLSVSVGGALRDLTNDVIYWAIVKERGDTPPLFDLNSIDDPDEVKILLPQTGGNEGKVQITMPNAISAQLVAGINSWGTEANFENFPDVGMTGRVSLVIQRDIPMVVGIPDPPAP